MRRKLLICVVLVVLIMGLAGYFTKGILAPKVGLCLSSADSALEKSLRDELVLAGFTVLTRNGENSQEKQNQQVEALLQKDVDILLIQAVDATAVAQIVQMAVETPVVFIGHEPVLLGNAYYVGCDVAQEGRVQAQLLDSLFAKADINGDRKVEYMVLSGPEKDPQSQLYVQNVTDTMAKYATERLQAVFCDGTSGAAKTLCRQAFSKYGRDLELILCSEDALASGAIAAVKDGGRTPGRDVVIFGVGTEAKLKEFVKTGALTAAILEDTDAVYARIIQVVGDLVKGKPVSQKNYVRYKVMTIENVGK